MRILPVIGLLAATLANGHLGLSAPPASGRADFSGRWTMNEELSTKPDSLIKKDASLAEETARAAAAGPSRGSKGGGSGTIGNLDVLMQALDDVKLITITDDGETVRVARAKGKERIIFPDGEERELDNGEGPAMVTAKRKGSGGERIVISSKWTLGKNMQETWELSTAPRRLTVVTKVSSRASFTFKRVYDPVESASASASQASVPIPTPMPTPVPVAQEAARPIGLNGCTVRPPRGTGAADLSRAARLSQADAERRVLVFVAPRKPSSVISSDAEVREGCLVWSFILRFPGLAGTEEVLIDAGNGTVLASEVEGR